MSRSAILADRRRHTVPKSALVLLGALVLQLSIVSDMRVFGAVGDLFLLVTIAAGLVDGPDRGATFGFAAGLLYDLVLDTPFALSALVYALVGYGVGLVSASLMRSTGWWPLGITAVASAVAMALYTTLGHLVGAAYPVGELPRIALVVALWNVVLILPVRALLRRIFGRREPDRIQLAFR
jgi:rod shape-determining protein MreD